jgi:hypothetical protein
MSPTLKTSRAFYFAQKFGVNSWAPNYSLVWKNFLFRLYLWYT